MSKSTPVRCPCYQLPRCSLDAEDAAVLLEEHDGLAVGNMTVSRAEPGQTFHIPLPVTDCIMFFKQSHPSPPQKQLKKSTSCDKTPNTYGTPAGNRPLKLVLQCCQWLTKWFWMHHCNS